MARFCEILLGLDKGFLSRPGDLSLQFNPQWPLQHLLDSVGGRVLSTYSGAVGRGLVIYVYRREEIDVLRTGWPACDWRLLLLVLRC